MLSPLICTPCYTERPTAIYVTSLVRLSPVPDLFMPSQCSLAAARMRSVERFLAGPWTDLFFIDDDIGFYPTTFRRMLTSGLDVVAAAAPYRSDDIKHQEGFTVDKADIISLTDPDGFAEITRIGAGFMRIQRHVLVKMSQHYSLAQFFALSLGQNDPSKVSIDIIEEDHSFCQRWQDIGGTVHIDTRAELAHQGTKVYTRDFATYLNQSSSDAES